MCYYKLFQFMGCGHVLISTRRLLQAPPCPYITGELSHTPKKVFFVPSNRTSPEDTEDSNASLPSEDPNCKSRLFHPAHILRIQTQCPNCATERADRLLEFQEMMIENRLVKEPSEPSDSPTVEEDPQSPSSKASSPEAENS